MKYSFFTDSWPIKMIVNNYIYFDFFFENSSQNGYSKETQANRQKNKEKELSGILFAFLKVIISIFCIWKLNFVSLVSYFCANMFIGRPGSSVFFFSSMLIYIAHIKKSHGNLYLYFYHIVQQTRYAYMLIYKSTYVVSIM